MSRAMSTSEVFLSTGLDLIQCTQRLESLWSSKSSGKAESLITRDLIETKEGFFEPSMRQVNSSGPIDSIDDLYEIASLVKPIFEVEMEKIVSLTGLQASSLSVAPLKGQIRALEKARDDYSARVPGPGISWLFDIVRGMIICDSEDAIIRVIECVLHLDASSPIEVIRLKNRYNWRAKL